MDGFLRTGFTSCLKYERFLHWRHNCHKHSIWHLLNIVSNYLVLIETDLLKTLKNVCLLLYQLHKKTTQVNIKCLYLWLIFRNIQENLSVQILLTKRPHIWYLMCYLFQWIDINYNGKTFSFFSKLTAYWLMARTHCPDVWSDKGSRKHWLEHLIFIRLVDQFSWSVFFYCGQKFEPTLPFLSNCHIVYTAPFIFGLLCCDQTRWGLIVGLHHSDILSNSIMNPFLSQTNSKTKGLRQASHYTFFVVRRIKSDTIWNNG